MIGFVGIGSMGYGMVSTLIRNFHKVMVLDLDKERMKSAETMGAIPAEGMKSLIENCSIVFLSLPNSKITISILEQEFLPNIKPEMILIDTGTTQVMDIERLSHEFKKRSAYLIDAPVSGGSIGSLRGELYCFVGGEKQATQKVWPILKTLASKKLTYCGKSGNGQITKYVNQLAMGLVDAAFLESIAFGVSAGVDPAVLMESIGGSEGFRFQFAEIAAKTATGQADSICCKYSEFEYFLHEADRKSIEAPILRIMNQYLERFKKNHLDNMGRSYPPFWSAILGKGEKNND